MRTKACERNWLPRSECTTVPTGLRRAMALRSAATAREDFILESIVDPNADVVTGYQPDVMPSTYESSLSDDQLDALVQYLVEGQQ